MNIKKLSILLILLITVFKQSNSLEPTKQALNEQTNYYYKFFQDAVNFYNEILNSGFKNNIQIGLYTLFIYKQIPLSKYLAARIMNPDSFSKNKLLNESDAEYTERIKDLDEIESKIRSSYFGFAYASLAYLLNYDTPIDCKKVFAFLMFSKGFYDTIQDLQNKIGSKGATK